MHFLITEIMSENVHNSFVKGNKKRPLGLVLLFSNSSSWEVEA